MRAMNMTKEHSIAFSFGYGATLAELREIFEETKDWPADATVSVTHYNGDQRDPSQTTIKVVRR